MKSKESPNLYEILKATPPRPEITSKPPEVVKPASNDPQVPSDAESQAPGPPPKPNPKPASVVALSPRPAAFHWPGDRVIQLSLNTVIFIALGGAGLLFVAYALGVRSGKTRSSEEEPIRPLRAAPTGDDPQSETILNSEQTKGEWTIRLMDWDAEGGRNRLIGMENAETLIKGLRRRGLKDGWYGQEERDGRKLIVLWYGRFSVRDSEETRALMQRLVRLRWKNRAIFAKSAGMERFQGD